MDIVKHTVNTIDFREILPGECFNFEDSFYIKTVRAGDVNAMAIKTGALSFFDFYEQVIPTPATVLIY